MNDIRSVQGYIVLYACREILREFLHFCLYSFGNVQRVAARLLIDSDGSGGFPVQLGYYAVRGRAQVDVRHVAQTEYLPSGFGTQDNVAELFGRGKSALYGQAVLIGIFIVRADGLPYVTCADFHIL